MIDNLEKSLSYKCLNEQRQRKFISYQMYGIHCTSRPPLPYWYRWKAYLLRDALITHTYYYIISQRGLSRRLSVHQTTLFTEYKLYNHVIRIAVADWIS